MITDLVNAARAGDRSAFDGLVNALAADLRIFVASRAVDYEQVEETCQATWVAAWRGLRDWREDGPFEHWLRGIARNKLLQDLTRRARRCARIESGQELLEEALTVAALADAERADPRLERLPDCLKRLMPRARAILIARHCADETMASLAQRFKQPMAALATALWRIRQTLRACLDEKP